MEKNTFSLDHIYSLSGDDSDFVVDILSMFIKQAEEETQRIHDFAAKSDWDQVKFVAHRLRSSAGSVGAFKIAEKCSDLERYVKSANDIEKEVHLYLQKFKETSNKEVSEIREALSSLLNGGGKTSVNR